MQSRTEGPETSHAHPSWDEIRNSGDSRHDTPPHHIRREMVPGVGLVYRKPFSWAKLWRRIQWAIVLAILPAGLALAYRIEPQFPTAAFLMLKVPAFYVPHIVHWAPPARPGVWKSFPPPALHEPSIQRPYWTFELGTKPVTAIGADYGVSPSMMKTANWCLPDIDHVEPSQHVYVPLLLTDDDLRGRMKQGQFFIPFNPCAEPSDRLAKRQAAAGKSPKL